MRLYRGVVICENLRPIKFRKMCIAVVKENAGAVRCYTGVGFRQEGEQKEMWPDATTGKYASNLWLGITREEYEKEVKNGEVL